MSIPGFQSPQARSVDEYVSDLVRREKTKSPDLVDLPDGGPLSDAQWARLMSARSRVEVLEDRIVELETKLREVK